MDGNHRHRWNHNVDDYCSYTYDGLGRLESEYTAGFAANYEYDRSGNRITMSVSEGEGFNYKTHYEVSYEYDKNNRLTRDTKIAGSSITVSNSHCDPNGNQITKRSETLNPVESILSQVGFGMADVELYDYDGFNRLTRSLVDGIETQYTYRADGMRLTKETSAGKTTHV